MSKQPAVPYCTVKGFRSCLEALRRDPPEVVDRQALVERGLSPHAAYPVLGALRFLALVDDAGRLLPTVDAFLGDDVIARRRLVEAAYGPVLKDVRFPVEDRELVDRVLIDKHGVAPGVAPFCATFFLWLAAESGLPVSDLARHRRGRPPAHLALLSDAARRTIVAAFAATGDGRARVERAREEVVLPPPAVRPGAARVSDG